MLLGFFKTYTISNYVETIPAITVPQYIYRSDGTTIWRKGMRGDYFVWDVALTPLGFSYGGVEDTDWVNRFSIPKTV